MLHKLFISLLLVSISTPASAAIVIQDDLGRNISIDAPAKRVIALYSAFNEIIDRIDGNQILIARTAAEKDNASLQHLPSIGTHMRPNLELIVGLAPDLVLQMGGREEATQAVYDLDRLGITTAYFSVTSFDDLFRVISTLGSLLGKEAASTALVDHMRLRLAKIAMAIPMNHDRPSVFFEVRSPNLLTVGSASMVSDIIEKAGGTNCIRSDAKLLRINEEEVFRISPDYYILQRGHMNSSPIAMPDRPRLNRLSSVINGRWRVVDEQLFSRPGPRNIDAVEQLAGILHPDIQF